MKTILVSCLLFFATASYLQAQQSSIKLLAEVPLQFGIGYEGRLSHRFSFSLQAGVLTPPNSTLIVNLLEDFGTDPQVVLIIKDAFKFGTVGELGLNYNFKRNYIGTFVQVIALHAGDSPSDLVETYFNEDINSYPLKRGRTQTSEKNLILKSTLYQAGLLYGRRFPFKNKRFEIDAEIGASANIGSVSTLSSDVRNLNSLSDEVNKELQYDYSHYAFIPNLTVMLVYKLNTK